MKKALIVFAATATLIAVIIGALVIAEFRAKADLESKVSGFLDGCGIAASSIDVHGRPYLLTAAEGLAEMTIITLDPADGTNSDQLYVHRLHDGRADRFTRFITVDYPADGAEPVLNPDGSLTEVATIDGKKVTFDAKTSDDNGAQTLHILADGDEFERIDMPQPTEVRTVAAGDDGVLVEVEYTSSDCR